MKKIVACRVLENYRLWLRFDDHVEGEVDLSDMVGKGVFAAWNDYGVFQQVRLDERGGITWAGDLDLCPDSLYLEVTGLKPEDLFPPLKEAQVYA